MSEYPFFILCMGAVPLGSLGQALMLQPSDALDGTLSVFTAHEMLTAQPLLDPSLEALHPAVGLGASGAGEPMLDAQGLAELITLVWAAGALSPRANQPVGGLRSVGCNLFRILTGHALARTATKARAA